MGTAPSRSISSRSRSRPSRHRPRSSFLGTVLGGVAKMGIVYSLSRIALGVIREKQPNMTRRQQTILETRLFSAFEAILRGDVATGIARLLPLLFLITNDVNQARSMMNTVINKAHQEDDSIPTAPPMDVDQEPSAPVEYPVEPVTPTQQSELVTLGCRADFVSGLPRCAADDIAVAIRHAIRDNSQDPITLENMTSRGRLRPNITAVLQQRESGFHVFLFDHDALSDWLAQSSQNPLTRQQISHTYQLS
ncbi:hypothetical protein GEMRC1_002851 [Eukaryota sp. GEM-RC1]